MPVNGIGRSQPVQSVATAPPVAPPVERALQLSPALKWGDFHPAAAIHLLDLQGAPHSAPATARQLQQHDALWGVQGVRAAERADTAVDPGKVGVVLNNHPLNLPAGQELRDLGVTAARISLSGDNFRPDDPALVDGERTNAQVWSDCLADYRAQGIDVTFNLPRELDGSGTFPEPPAREQTGVDEQGQPVWRVLPSDQQPLEWRDQFDAWKRDAYLPAVQRVVDTLGPSAGAYEVWNEPDEQANRSDYSPGLPAGQFGELLRDVYGIVRGPDADPDVPPAEGQPRIIAGGLDSGRADWLDGASVDGKLYADVVGVHPYLKRPDESYDADHPENWTGTVADIARDYDRFNRPITFTEAGDRRGYGGDNPDPAQTEHRPYIPELATAAGRQPNVERSYFFWEDPYDGEFGLTGGRDDGGNPIYRAGASELQRRIQQWSEEQGE